MRAKREIESYLNFSAKNGTIRLTRASHASCGTTGQQGLLNMRFRSLHHVYIFSLQDTLKYLINRLFSTDKYLTLFSLRKLFRLILVLRNFEAYKVLLSISEKLLRPNTYDYLVLYRLQRSCIRRRTLFRVHAAFESHKLDLLPEASKLRTKDEDDLNRFTYSITPLLSPKKVLEKWGIDPFQPWNS